MIHPDELNSALSTVATSIKNGNLGVAQETIQKLIEGVPPDSPYHSQVLAIRASVDAAVKAQPFQEYIIDRDLGDIQFKFLIGDPIGEEWYTNVPNTLPQISFTRSHMVKSTDIIFDVGAHHGHFTIMLARWANQGKVLAFEAHPHNAKLLARNVLLNNLTNVGVENKAVSDIEGTCTIRGAPNSCVCLQGESGLTQPVTFLDKYAHLNPTLLKIDVEGLEVEVLQGAKSILATRPKLIIEIHVPELRSYGHSSKNVLDILRPLNYSAWLEIAQRAPVPYNWTSLDEITEGGVQLYALPN